MDRNYIIQQGDKSKYQILIDYEDFEQDEHDFFVVLTWGIPSQHVIIRKEDMIVNEDAQWFVVFDSSEMLGRLMAECHYFIPDSDVDGGVREAIDRQYIGYVVTNGCPKFSCKKICSTGSQHVFYRRVFGNDVNTSWLNLRTSSKEPIRDSEGNQLRVHKEEKDIYYH